MRFAGMLAQQGSWGPEMPIRRLERSTWNNYFDLVSKIVLVGKRAEVEVASLSFGVQIEAEWVLLLGIVYDERDDVLEITLDGLDHLIHRPLEVHVDEGASSGISGFAVLDHAGCHHIVRLRDPLMLPAPARVL